jgi:hypothetical protein
MISEEHPQEILLVPDGRTMVTEVKDNRPVEVMILDAMDDLPFELDLNFPPPVDLT